MIWSAVSLGQLSKQWLLSTRKNKVCFYFAKRKYNHENDVRKQRWYLNVTCLIIITGLTQKFIVNGNENKPCFYSLRQLADFCFYELSANDWKQTEEDWPKSEGLCQRFIFIKGDNAVVSHWKPFIYWHTGTEMSCKLTEWRSNRCLPTVFRH